MWWVLASGARLGGGGAVEVPVLRIVVGLVVCTMVALLAVLALRHRLAHRGLPGLARRLPRMVRAIEVVEMRRLGMHAEVGLVRHRGRDYLLVVQGGGGGVTVLDTHDAPPATGPAA